MTKKIKGWLDGPKIWSWGGGPKGEGELQCGGGPTENDLYELYKALHGHPSLYGPPSQWLPDQKGHVTIPFRLFIMLSNLLDWNVRQLPWTQERKDWLRAALVAQEHAAGETMEDAAAAVAERLTEGETVKGIKGEPSPAAAGDEMVKKSYYDVMAEQRPRRTRTRKPRQ
jgi:hypothetical protein